MKALSKIRIFCKKILALFLCFTLIFSNKFISLANNGIDETTIESSVSQVEEKVEEVVGEKELEELEDEENEEELEEPEDEENDMAEEELEEPEEDNDEEFGKALEDIEETTEETTKEATDNETEDIEEATPSELDEDLFSRPLMNMPMFGSANPNEGFWWCDDTNMTLHLVADDTDAQYQNAPDEYKGQFTFGNFASDNFVTTTHDTLNHEIKKVVFDARFRPTTTQYFFRGRSSSQNCKQLEEIKNLAYLDTTDVVSFDSMFSDCINLKYIDLSNFNTSSATNMETMFSYCEAITNLNVANFDTSNVTNMRNMFGGCINLQNLNLRNFNTSALETMGSMFKDCQKLQTLDLSSFVTPHLTSMSRCFQNCKELRNINISNIDTTNVSNMANLFSGCENLESINLSNFNTSNTQVIDDMFNGCIKLKTIDLSHFNTLSLQHCENMFEGCESLQELDLSNFNTPNLERMQEMFSGCKKLKTLKLSNLDVTNVTHYDDVLLDCPRLSHIFISSSFSNKINDVGLTNSWKNVGTGLVYEEDASHRTTIPVGQGEYLRMNYTITFNSNGGSEATPSEVKIKLDELVKKPNNPTKNGYTFVAWIWEGVNFNFNVAPNDDVDLIASWKQNGGGHSGGGGGGGGSSYIPSIPLENDLLLVNKSYTILELLAMGLKIGVYSSETKNTNYDATFTYNQFTDKFEMVGASPIINSWVLIGNDKTSHRWFYCNENGEIMRLNFKEINGSIYYFDENGNMATGLKNILGTEYHFDETRGINEGRFLELKNQ